MGNCYTSQPLQHDVVTIVTNEEPQVVPTVLQVRLPNRMQSIKALSDQDYDAPTIYNFQNPIVGISYPNTRPDSFRIIFNDGTRTTNDASDIERISNLQWKDETIPQGTIVRIVYLLYDKKDAQVLGIKFCDEQDNKLISSEYFELLEQSNNADVQLMTVQLENGERLVGVKFCTRGRKNSMLYDVQFVIGKMVKQK